MALKSRTMYSCPMKCLRQWPHIWVRPGAGCPPGWRSFRAWIGRPSWCKDSPITPSSEHDHYTLHNMCHHLPSTLCDLFSFSGLSASTRIRENDPQRTIHNTVPEVAATAHPLAQRKVMINVMMAYSCRYFSAFFQDFHLRMPKAVYNHSIPWGTMTWDLTSEDRTGHSNLDFPKIRGSPLLN